jgi:hypothetical protein
MAYRDDLEAARARRDTLHRELRALHGRMGELAGLQAHERALTRELGQLATDLDHARARAVAARLPQAGQASPCSMSWDLMRGGDFVRSCGRCGNRVFDISGLDDEQTRRFLAETCATGRVYRRSDGTLLERDCPAGRTQRRANALLVGLAVMASALAAVIWGGAAMRARAGAPGHVSELPAALIHVKQRGPVAVPPRPPPEPDPIAMCRVPYDAETRAQWRVAATSASVPGPAALAPSGRRARLSRSDITTAIGGVRPQVQACARGDTGQVRISVRVAPDGRVVETTDTSTQPPSRRLSACVRQAVAQAKFPHTDQGGTFRYPFVF